MDPLEILPEEVWRLVLDKLTTPKGLLIAHNTCQLWRSLLKENQTVWMFPDIFPLLVNYLPKSDILDARLICKSWNKVIDNYLETEQPSITAPGSHYLISQRTTLRILEVDFDIVGDRLDSGPVQAMGAFQRQFKTDDKSKGRKNPFVSRSLHLTVTAMDLEILEFFEKFGANLWSLRLSLLQLVPPEITSPVQIATFIWSILSSTPNLRKLDLYAMQNVEDFPNIFSKQEKKAQMLELHQFLDNNRAPPLPLLSNLHLDLSFHLMRKALETAYAPQLTKYVHLTSHKFVPSNLTNLKEVAWHFVDGFKAQHLNKFKSLGSSCLQRLHIYVSTNLTGRNRFRNDSLLEAIESFGSSITYLSLCWKYFEGTVPPQLNLPFVKELCVEIGPYQQIDKFNFYFVQTLQSLCKLKFTFWRKTYPKPFGTQEEERGNDLTEENVDLHLHLNDDDDTQDGPYQSNIWRLVPSLEVIEICTIGFRFAELVTESKIYTRDQMDKNKNEQQHESCY